VLRPRHWVVAALVASCAVTSIGASATPAWAGCDADGYSLSVRRAGDDVWYLLDCPGPTSAFLDRMGVRVGALASPRPDVATDPAYDFRLDGPGGTAVVWSTWRGAAGPGSWTRVPNLPGQRLAAPGTANAMPVTPGWFRVRLGTGLVLGLQDRGVVVEAASGCGADPPLRVRVDGHRAAAMLVCDLADEIAWLGLTSVTASPEPPAGDLGRPVDLVFERLLIPRPNHLVTVRVYPDADGGPAVLVPEAGTVGWGGASATVVAGWRPVASGAAPALLTALTGVEAGEDPPEAAPAGTAPGAGGGFDPVVALSLVAIVVAFLVLRRRTRER